MKKKSHNQPDKLGEKLPAVTWREAFKNGIKDRKFLLKIRERDVKILSRPILKLTLSIKHEPTT